jgi:hypothetical protein
LFILFIAVYGINYGQEIQIKSLKAYTEQRSALPIFFHNKKLNIEFDVEAAAKPNLVIVFRFCDKNWKPYDNIFLRNVGSDIERNLILQRLPSPVIQAQYHYAGFFPNQNKYVSFPYDGNWRFYVTGFMDTSRIYAQGKFFVVDTLTNLKVFKKNEQLEDKNYFPTDLNKVFNIETNFYLPRDFIPSDVQGIEIIENHKVDYPEFIDRNLNTNTKQFYWDGDRSFKFIDRQIRPGNGNRETDFRDINQYNSQNINAQIDGTEYSRFFQFSDNDLNGGDILLNYDNNNATYLNVTFSFEPPNNDYSNIFIVGSFNNWKVSPEYQMKRSGELFSIIKSLKRGIYDYQYVTADLNGNQISNIDWYVFEGNFYETSNDYYIFLYYNDPDYGGYDRIIGFYKLKT